MGRYTLRLFVGCVSLLAAAACNPFASSDDTPTPRPPVPSTTAVAGSPSPTPEPPTLAEAYRTVKSGVVRFEAAGCTDAWQGSGFEISPTLVATVAHVVDGGQVIRVIQGKTSTAGYVIGIDPGTDVALVHTFAPLSGHRLAFAATPPRVGDQVAAIGFPRGKPSYNTGTVNGLHRKSVIDGIPRHGLIEIDAATAPGSSGGPVIDANGDVVGLVDAGPVDNDPGRRLAVSSRTARPLIEGWRAVPQSVDPGTCDSVLGPDGQPLPASKFPTTDEQEAFATLELYLESIDGGDFSTALAQLRYPGSLKRFRRGVESSQDSDWTVHPATRDGDSLVLWVTFTSLQDPGSGPTERPDESCTRWSLDYRFSRHNGLWLIASTEAHEPGAASAPC